MRQCRAVCLRLCDHSTRRVDPSDSYKYKLCITNNSTTSNSAHYIYGIGVYLPVLSLHEQDL